MALSAGTTYHDDGRAMAVCAGRYRRPVKAATLADGARALELFRARAVVIVDAADFDRVAPFTWWLGAGRAGQRYVMGYVPGRGRVYMHRHLVDASAGQVVDHRDGDRFNNRRANLRLATNAENSRNRHRKPDSASSSFKGVSFAKREGKFEAYIAYDGRKINLGLFADEIDAAHAYDSAARELFGEFAHTNFPAGIAL